MRINVLVFGNSLIILSYFILRSTLVNRRLHMFLHINVHIQAQYCYDWMP